ncbi:MAG: Dihydrolipoamide acetyltransferase component of pyruvate dehydrogenase complex [Marmoricola sp.]|jgi:pyruvate dehydrogenase E2 component (dihydrolipoamide acetyltransferase)|nr:Dihydrolipoamide acetyltransferase component of pyruvate dehydrogenase complex [Marmoricola sp.]
MQLVRLPRLGQTMEKGIITLWVVSEGETFASGQPLYEVETEKMVTEVEARQDGVLARILVPGGNDEVPVGVALAVIADAGEAIDATAVDAFLGGDGGAVAAEPESETESETESGPEVGPEVEPQVEHDRLRTLAVPKARAVAKRRDIDISEVIGTGVDGTVRVIDVLKESKARKKAAGPPSRPQPAAAPPEGAPLVRAVVQDDVPQDGDVSPRVAARIAVRGVARSMAESMTRSWTEVPQFVQQLSLDATALKARLARLRYEGVPVTYTDLLVSAVALAAVEVPEVNSSFAGDEIVQYADVNVSVAVATDRGLLVPVVRRAQELSIDQVARTTKSLAERAKAGKLGSDDLSGGTITLSNLGAFGIETGTPIINLPQSALVFVGTMSDQPVVVNGAVVVQPRLNVAIAYDHRVLDGMTAAGFSSALRTRLEAGG